MHFFSKKMRWKQNRHHDEMNSKYNQPTYDGKEGSRKRKKARDFEDGEKRENQ